MLRGALCEKFHETCPTDREKSGELQIGRYLQVSFSLLGPREIHMSPKNGTNFKEETSLPTTVIQGNVSLIVIGGVVLFESLCLLDTFYLSENLLVRQLQSSSWKVLITFLISAV